MELGTELKGLIGEIRFVGFGPISDELKRAGWLECNGQALDRTKYRHLYRRIGVTWGSGGADDFNIPDLRGILLQPDHSPVNGRVTPIIYTAESP